MVIGEKEIIKMLEQTIGKPLNPMVTSKHRNPDFIEILISSTGFKVQKALLEELKKNHEVDIRYFALKYTSSNKGKVRRAVRGLINDNPDLEPHLQMDEGKIRLVDIPPPL